MTGSVTGATAIAVVSVLALTLRTPRAGRRVVRELSTHVVVLGVLLGGGALANEYLLKPAVTAPRPNIVALAEAGVLGMAPEAWYDSMDREERRNHLHDVLSDPTREAPALTDRVRTHWIHEAGFSFPSGHSFSAMLLSTYFVLLGSALALTGWRRALYLLPVWAVGIAWSRVLLGVHRPADVIWGGLLGLLLGTGAAWLSIRQLRTILPQPAHRSRPPTD
jgi:phosphatidylglycerophosphatase B